MAPRRVQSNQPRSEFCDLIAPAWIIMTLYEIHSAEAIEEAPRVEGGHNLSRGSFRVDSLIVLQIRPTHDPRNHPASRWCTAQTIIQPPVNSQIHRFLRSIHIEGLSSRMKHFRRFSQRNPVIGLGASFGSPLG